MIFYKELSTFLDTFYKAVVSWQHTQKMQREARPQAGGGQTPDTEKADSWCLCIGSRYRKEMKKRNHYEK